MIGLIAVGSETTRLSAETIGNTWKSVLARMEQVKAGAKIDEEGEAINNVEKVLNKFGIQLRDSTSEFRNMEDVLDEVGNKWNTFDSVAQAQIATAIAGTHRINTFVATMENYDTVLKYTEESQDAAGTSAQKYTAYMDSIDAKLNTLTATWEQFVNNLNQSGTVKSVIDLGTKLIGVLDTLINKMGLLKVALPVVTVTLVSTKLLKLVQYFQNLGNAAKVVTPLVKNFNSASANSEKVIQEIATNLAGLSVKQRVALISSKNLTTAQQEQILVASGVSQAEAAAAVSAQVVGTSSLEATGGVVSLSAAWQGLTAAIEANPIGFILTAITATISIIVSAVNGYNQKIEESIRRAEELETEYKNMSGQLSSSIRSLESVKDEFNSLSAGVSDYGKNLTLSTEEYNRYKDIVAQITELTPSLIDGYNSQGEAIANKNGLVEESIRLLQEQKKEEAQSFVTEDIFDIAEGKIASIKELADQRKTITDLLTNSISHQESDFQAELRNFFGIAEGEVIDFQNLVENHAQELYSFLMKNSMGYEQEQISHIQDFARRNLNLYNQIVDAENSLNPSLQVIPQLVEGYEDLNDETKLFIQQYINTYKLGTKSTTDEINTWISEIENFTSLLVSAGPKVQGEILKLFSLDKTKISADTYKGLANQYIETILDGLELEEGSDERTNLEQELKIKMGIVIVDGDGNIIDTQQQMIDNLRDKLKDIKGLFDNLDTSDWTYEDFKLALKVDTNNIDSVEEFNAAMQELKNTTEGIIPTFEESQSAIASALDEFATTTQTVADHYDALKTAMDDFNNKGTISSKTLKELAKNDLVQYLSIVNGKIQINTQALSENIEAAKRKAKQDVLQNAFNQLLALSEDRVTEGAINSVDASATAAAQVESMGQAFANATLGVTSVSEALKHYYTITKKKPPEQFSDQEQEIMKNALDYVKLIDVVSDATSGASSGGGSASSKRSEALKEEKKNIEDLIEAFIKMYKQELKERKEAENAGYEITKRNFEDEKTIMERRFRDVKQHYEDLNKAQEKGAETRLDALEAEYDAYKKKIDAEKDLLKAKKEEEEYEKSLAEKTKDVAKIQSELAKLQFDDSIEAQKKRIELMGQLSDKQGDLDEFQKDHRYDLTEDALEKESDRYKDLYDERKKEIEDEKKAWKDLYDARIDALKREQTRWKDDFEDRKTSEQRTHEDRVNQIESEINDERKLRADAIAAIESQNKEAYNKPIEWNRLYGTGIDYDITQKWNIAKDALDKYGKTGVGIQGILDILAQKIETIASKTSSASSGFGGWYTGVDKTNTALDDTAEKLDKIKKTIRTLDDVDIFLKGSEKGKNIAPGITKNHTGTDYVAMNANDRLLNKSLGLKSDEVVRILKVGEGVIPKERNLKRLRENSDFVENSSLRRVSELSEVSQGSISDNSSHVSISIGDTIVQGDADNNIVNRLNEYKKSLVNEVFSRINKHTNLSGFRSSKRYV
nr:MAG TPA: minor tail protein [Caudoviricetes sp.]DAT69546.1 MAG TPA: minor tail protein [Caudoviricetes sp.]